MPGAGVHSWAYGRDADRRRRLLGRLPALLLAGAYLATPAMTTVIAVWNLRPGRRWHGTCRPWPIAA